MSDFEEKYDYQEIMVEDISQVMNELTYRHFIEDKAILLGKSLQVYAEIHLWMRVYRNLEIYYLK